MYRMLLLSIASVFCKLLLHFRKYCFFGAKLLVLDCHDGNLCSEKRKCIKREDIDTKKVFKASNDSRGH